MPIYSYKCNDCGEGFDLLVGVTSEKAELKCKKCSSKNIKKVISAFSVSSHTADKPCMDGDICPGGTCPGRSSCLG